MSRLDACATTGRSWLSWTAIVAGTLGGTRLKPETEILNHRVLVFSKCIPTGSIHAAQFQSNDLQDRHALRLSWSSLSVQGRRCQTSIFYSLRCPFRVDRALTCPGGIPEASDVD